MNPIKLPTDFKKQIEDIQGRQSLLTSIFRGISDIELLQEFEKRVRYLQTIKLSMNQDYFWAEARVGKVVLISYLPIEIKKKDHENPKCTVCKNQTELVTCHCQEPQQVYYCWNCKKHYPLLWN